ncbi:hypothetical protein [Acidaminococcus massiliensis]|jgi:hypothetical protein|uniref:hypothetical protein n=1 Tax=Acidaminococcus massiliensis TaxID=1852375 RepID=UPI00206AB844|nr:hypothetical protein [Acidaminococcus massiliensis]DAR24922.1 MAG TPA: hypothetical protein [Caudoviricetes sp.]
MEIYRKFVPAHYNYIRVYTFDELSDEAKENVRSYYENMYDNDCYGSYGEYVETIEKVAEIFDITPKFDGCDYLFFDDTYCKYCPDEMNVKRTIELINSRVFVSYKCSLQEGVDGACPFTGVFTDCTFFDVVKDFITEAKKSENRWFDCEEFFRQLAKAFSDEMEKDRDYCLSDEGLSEETSYLGIVFKGDFKMKNILIKEENAGKIYDLIDKAEKGCKVRLLDVMEIYDLTCEIMNTVRIPRKQMDGIGVWCDPSAQKFPGSYKYKPMSTQFLVVIKNGKPYIKEIFRSECGSIRLRWYFPQEAKKDIALSLLYHITLENNNVKTWDYDEGKVRKILNETINEKID